MGLPTWTPDSAGGADENGDPAWISGVAGSGGTLADIMGIETVTAFRKRRERTSSGGYRILDEEEMVGSPFPVILEVKSALPKRVEASPGFAHIDTSVVLRTDDPPDGLLMAQDVIVRENGERYRVIRARFENGKYVAYLEGGAT